MSSNVAQLRMISHIESHCFELYIIHKEYYKLCIHSSIGLGYIPEA